MRLSNALLCVLVLAALPATATAQPVISVVTARTKGDDAAYLVKLEAAKPIVMRLGASSYRVFRAAFAGEGSGAIVSVAEYKDWPTFAEARAKRTTDEAFQKWYRDLVGSGVSELVSIELLEEITLAP
jgi:hypothetical protein